MKMYEALELRKARKEYTDKRGYRFVYDESTKKYKYVGKGSKQTKKVDWDKEEQRQEERIKTGKVKSNNTYSEGMNTVGGGGSVYKKHHQDAMVSVRHQAYLDEVARWEKEHPGQKVQPANRSKVVVNRYGVTDDKEIKITPAMIDSYRSKLNKLLIVNDRTKEIYSKELDMSLKKKDRLNALFCFATIDQWAKQNEEYLRQKREDNSDVISRTDKIKRDAKYRKHLRTSKIKQDKTKWFGKKSTASERRNRRYKRF